MKRNWPRFKGTIQFAGIPEFELNSLQVTGFPFYLFQGHRLLVLTVPFPGFSLLEHDRYALIEVKLGQSETDAGARHLLEIERLIIEHNKNEEQVPLRMPDLKIVITGTKYGYVRPDGVYVIPIGCLKD